MSIVFIILIISIISVNTALWVFFMPWYVGKKINCYQNELVDRHYKEVETMYRKMRGWRHDYHNHIQVLQAQLELYQYTDAVEYLKNLADDLLKVDTVQKTGNTMVDAIISSKLALMKERNIRIDITAHVPQDILISGVDLCVLLGNMLDNAMEACSEISDIKDRFIRIYIDIVKNHLYIAVTNSMKEGCKKEGRRYLSSKIGAHGFGLLRIDSIVSKYNGFVNRQNEQDVFATEVMIPLWKEESTL